MISAKTSAAATITAGGKGQFDVLRDGSVIWSKEETGRFPEDREILERLAS